MQRAIIFIAYFFICVNCFPQQYPFVHYTPKDGLLSSRVRNIYQDSKGRIYFTTQRGLSVYDGARLNKLGGKLEYGDMPFRYWMKPEPLGIEKFILTIPEYIMDGGMPAANNEMEWNDYRRRIEEAINKVGNIKLLEAKADAYTARFLANPMIEKPYNNPVFRNAKRKMALLFEWQADRVPWLDKKMNEAEDSVVKWHQEYRNAVNAHKEYNNTRGMPGDCGVLKSLAFAFNIKTNTLWQQRNSELLFL